MIGLEKDAVNQVTRDWPHAWLRVLHLQGLGGIRPLGSHRSGSWLILGLVRAIVGVLLQFCVPWYDCDNLKTAMWVYEHPGNWQKPPIGSPHPPGACCSPFISTQQTPPESGVPKAEDAPDLMRKVFLDLWMLCFLGSWAPCF
jgi:hypothetical protein